MTSRCASLLTSVLTALALASCGGGDTPTDSGLLDQGMDLGPSDTGFVDTGLPTDSGLDDVYLGDAQYDTALVLCTGSEWIILSRDIA